MMSQFYHKSMNKIEQYVPLKLLPFWRHPAGPQTIFFWAPLVKWGLVLAGIGDLTRPVENLSVSQSATLAATGVIWSRYSLVIYPRSYNLFSVNMFVAITQLGQLYRALSYQRTIQKEKQTQ